MEKINILCFGDSNTYGYVPIVGNRYSEEIRWTKRLQHLLGENYNVIEEGCNGRTTVFGNPEEEWLRGIDYLKPCLNTHKPLHLVIMMLGSNDLKSYFNASAEMIADGARELVKVIKEFTDYKQGFVPKILVVAPPVVGDGIAASCFNGEFDETAITRSLQFKELYGKMAAEEGCEFISAADYVKSSDEDSLHLTPEGHKNLAEAFNKIINALFEH